MTNEEKQLLLKDLCARLPYNLWVRYEDKDYLVTGYGHGRVSLLPSVFSSAVSSCPLIEEVCLYLRPMSSMTDDEKKEYEDCFIVRERDGYNNQDKPIYTGEELVYVDDIKECIDWLNAHHFDYRGLIEKGLALEAPEEMYKEE